MDGTTFRSGITETGDEFIRIRGYDVTELMRNSSMADLVFLLHQSRLPSAEERRLLDAMLISSSDHGPGSPSALTARVVTSGNRRAPEAAVAAGLLAVGDFHGGAGEQCMTFLRDGLDAAHEAGQDIAWAAGQIVGAAMAGGRRLPGLGHRTHDEDPRATTLFALARETGLAGDGVDLIQAVQAEASRRIRPLPINVDGAMAGVLLDMGFEPLAARFIFLIGRAAGLTAQVSEEITRERPMRIRVPQHYDGPAPRSLTEDAGSSYEPVP